MAVQSEFQRAMASIDAEVEAARHLNGFTYCARHDFINARMRGLNQARKKAEPVLGKAVTLKLFEEAMEAMYTLIPRATLASTPGPGAFKQ